MQATFSKSLGFTFRRECMFKCRFRIYYQIQGLLRQLLALDVSRGGASPQKLEKHVPDELSPKPDPYELRAPRGCSLSVIP